MRWLLLLLAGCDGVFGVRFVDPLIDAHPDGPPDAQSTYQSTILGDHPVAYFPLDDLVASDPMVVDLAGGPAGTIAGLAIGGGDPPFPAANHAFTFNGTNSSIELGDVFPFEGNAPFTLEAWVLNGREDTQFNYAILSKWRQPSSALPPSGWLFYYQEGDTLIPTFRFQRQDATGVGLSANASPTTEGPAWHYVVARYDGTEVAVFLDGVYASSIASPVQLEHLDYTLEIGSQNGNSHDGPMLGSLDEVAIYDYALTDATILRHYDARSL